MSDRPRVVIADDAVLLREGIRHLLNSGGCDVVATASDIEELESVLGRSRDIDAIVLDIRMPPGHGDEGMRELESLRARGSTVGVLLLSMYASPTLALRAMSAGRGTGYLLKDRVNDGDVLVAAIRTVMNGGTVVDPEIISMLVGSTGRTSLIDQLTEREHEVLHLMAEGRSNLGIATAMHLSIKTVETHVAHILDKLGIEQSPNEHRRVLAVLELLRSAG